MTPKPRSRRTTPDTQPPTTPVPPGGGPVVLPVVEFTITADGAMTATVDGHPYLPEPFAPGWRREAFPTILDALTAQYRSPLRVQGRRLPPVRLRALPVRWQCWMWRNRPAAATR